MRTPTGLRPLTDAFTTVECLAFTAHTRLRHYLKADLAAEVASGVVGRQVLYSRHDGINEELWV